jgi:charged multivesicular body protein 6
MLGGRISNQDEDEVEDELEALEREAAGIKLPQVPTSVALPEVPITDSPVEQTAEQRAKERAKARQREREEQRTAMLA